ncbi:MAG: PIN domain-containing protein [Nanoarchaeota archaeon]
MIFDTNFVIDVMNGKPAAIEKLKGIIKNGEPEFVTAPTIFELFSGLSQCSKPELERKKILSALSRMTILHLDAEAAERGGELDGLLVKSGHQIDPIDSMIAGVALAKGEKILTRDKDFSKVAGLKVDSW